MSAARDVQESMFPDLVPARPQGYIVPSVFRGNNADLIAAIAPMYIQGSVMDATYGEGGWWLRCRPDQLVQHDIDSDKGDGVDFAALPEPDDSYDTVAFDPPYIPQGGVKHRTNGDFKGRFGLVQRSERALWALIESGFVECVRVLRPRGYLLVKCTDYCNGSRLTFGHVRMMELGTKYGADCHDLIVHHTGSGPGGHNIYTPIRARRHHSYLLVFKKTP